MLISCGHEKTYWHPVFGARLEFRGACGERCGRTHTERGNCHRPQQPGRRAGNRKGAQARNIEALVIPSRGLEREAYDKQVIAALQERKVDLVCLAGYMRLLSPQFVAAFRNHILNIHPSLLAGISRGLKRSGKALDHGAKFSGCTVHFVDENLDAGPIVLQACVPIEDRDTPDTLAERILHEEHRIYAEAVRIVLEGRYRM